MAEPINRSPNINLPSGYVSSEQIAEHPAIGSETLPWLSEPRQLNIARCEVEGGDSFLLASAVGTHDRLKAAADAMTPPQRRIADNMFYSRLPPFMANKYSRTVETMADPTTPFPLHVMRNKGGQRVYFGVAPISLSPGEEPQPVVLRLGVCDKNRQDEVFKVLSSTKPGEQRSKKK